MIQYMKAYQTICSKGNNLEDNKKKFWRSICRQLSQMSERESFCSLWKKSSEIKWKEIKAMKTAVNNTWPCKQLLDDRILKAADCCLDHKDRPWRPLNNTRLRFLKKARFFVWKKRHNYIFWKFFPMMCCAVTFLYFLLVLYVTIFLALNKLSHLFIRVWVSTL